MDYKNIPKQVIGAITYSGKLIKALIAQELERLSSVEKLEEKLKDAEAKHKDSGYADHQLYLRINWLDELIKNKKGKPKEIHELTLSTEYFD